MEKIAIKDTIEKSELEMWRTRPRCRGQPLTAVVPGVRKWQSQRDKQFHPQESNNVQSLFLRNVDHNLATGNVGTSKHTVYCVFLGVVHWAKCLSGFISG